MTLPGPSPFWCHISYPGSRLRAAQHCMDRAATASCSCAGQQPCREYLFHRGRSHQESQKLAQFVFKKVTRSSRSLRRLCPEVVLGCAGVPLRHGAGAVLLPRGARAVLLCRETGALLLGCGADEMAWAWAAAVLYGVAPLSCCCV